MVLRVIVLLLRHEPATRKAGGGGERERGVDGESGSEGRREGARAFARPGAQRALEEGAPHEAVSLGEVGGAGGGAGPTCRK